MIEPFNWEREYGALYRAAPSAFWLAPGPGDRKRDVIDVRANDDRPAFDVLRPMRPGEYRFVEYPGVFNKLAHALHVQNQQIAGLV